MSMAFSLDMLELGLERTRHELWGLYCTVGLTLMVIGCGVPCSFCCRWETLDIDCFFKSRCGYASLESLEALVESTPLACAALLL